MLPNFPGMDLRHMGMLNNGLTPQTLMEENINYYQEACKLYIANVVLTTQMKELVSEKNELLQKIAKLEKRVNDNQSLSSQAADDKKKRHRRIANEIDRHYNCPIEICQKSYGSEGSLTQHLKIKHPDYFAKIGLSQLNALKDFDEFKSETSEEKNDEREKKEILDLNEKEKNEKKNEQNEEKIAPA